MKIKNFRALVSAGLLGGTMLIGSVTFANPMHFEQGRDLDLSLLAVTNKKITNIDKSKTDKTTNVNKSKNSKVDNSKHVDKSTNVNKSKTNIKDSFNEDNSTNTDNSDYNSHNTDNSNYNQTTNYGSSDWSEGKTVITKNETRNEQNINSKNNKTEQNINSKNKTTNKTTNKTRVTQNQNINSNNRDSHDINNSNNTRQEQKINNSSKLPSDAISYNGHHYKLFNEGKTWQSAKSYCEQLGGYLVIITSSGEQTFIKDLVQNKGTKNSYWMGASLGSDGKYHWVDGTPFTYSHWGYQQPDTDGGQATALMMYRGNNYYSSLGDWNDLNPNGTCGDQAFFGLNNFGFICEWDY